MAKKDELIVTAAPGEELLMVDPDDLDTSFENIRTGDYSTGDSKDDGKGQSHVELVESIESNGQRNPGIGRRNAKGKIQLIAGFRRLAAVKSINDDNKTGERLKFKVIVKPLDDLAAVLENAIENQREGLRGADMMMGLWRIKTMSAANGATLSNRKIAGIVGINQSYASDLITIREKAPECAIEWHKAKYQLGIREMRTLTKIEDAKLRLETYNKMLADRMPPEEGDGDAPAPTVWIDRAIKQVERAAAILGHLERRGCIKSKPFSWEEELETLGAKIKEGAKKKERNRIARKAENAYNEAFNWVEPETEESDEEAAE